jgi:phage anti-repressor protein
MKEPNEKHNNCQNIIGGRELVTALERSEQYKGWRCESCRSAAEK